MFYHLQAKSIQCPYCWESIEILIDGSVEEQDYVEDCQVCCRPIRFHVAVGTNDDVKLQVRSEDDN